MSAVHGSDPSECPRASGPLFVWEPRPEQDAFVARVARRFSVWLTKYAQPAWLRAESPLWMVRIFVPAGEWGVRMPDFLGSETEAKDRAERFFRSELAPLIGIFRAEEREACAQIAVGLAVLCDASLVSLDDEVEPGPRCEERRAALVGRRDIARDIADAIRARSNGGAG